MWSPLWLSVCLPMLLLLLPLPFALGDNVKINATEPAALPAAASLVGSNSSDLLPTAEKLIRYRRHPPHVLRAASKRSKQRRRVKSPAPKIRYGPPSYPAAAPISSYYKPSLAPSFPTHIEEPSFSLDDFQHLKFDGADFKIPASSYEAQSMDLNLYSHEDQELYGAHKFPTLEYSFSGAGHESPPLSTYEHTPHQKYGVPPLQQSIGPSSYERPESFISHHYGAPAQTPPSGPPSTHYGVPSAPAHAPSFTHSAPPPPPPAPDSYSIYEQKIPNTGYHQSFAEPPRAPPAHSSNFEIAYSPPAYEISTSYQSNQPQYEHPAQDGNFAEPPPSAPPQHPALNYAPPDVHQPNNYAPPETHPPRSYAPPEQHPPSNYAPPEAHPPNSYAPPETHPPNSYTPPAAHPPSNYAPPEPPVESYPQENYAPPSEELPLNPNHKFPSFDFPKSSYEVPIYDPIPFEASNKEEQESYPPNLAESNSNDLPVDAHASGSSQKKRKRKRRPSPSAVLSKKHTLDVPELQQAYDADSHVHVRGTDVDTAAHGSSHVEQKRNYVSFVTPSTKTTTTTTTAPWSPMRFRTTSSGAFIPTIITTTPPSRTTSRSRSRGTSRYRSRNSPSSTTEIASTSVTIQKSRSQSYYDGTLAPPTYQQFPVLAGRGTRPTRPAQARGVGHTLALQPNTERNPTLKRTTKGVFDTTYFKSPQSDREMERKLNVLRQNLPKNHKLY